MEKEFNVIIEKDEEGFYIASVPSLKGCHTQAKSLDELLKRIKEAIELCLQDQEIVYNYDFIGVQKVTIKERSHRYSSSKRGKKNIHQR